MRLIVGLLIVVLVPLLAMHIVGARMPREHRAWRSKRIQGTAADVFLAITNVERFPAWRKGMKAVERLGDVDGKHRYRETTGQGTLTFDVDEATPPSRLITRIVDEGQPFGGRWTFDLRPDAGATDITITEDGYVNPPIFRFLSRYAFGHTATIDAYLNDLEKHFSTREV